MACHRPSVMVCLISRQTMQNLLPILQHRPQKVVCLTTRQEDASRTHLTTVLQALRIPCAPPLYVDAYDPAATAHACRQVLDQYGASHLAANITGGTKVMSLTAFRAFSAADVPCLYTDTPNQRLLYLHPGDKQPEPLAGTARAVPAHLRQRMQTLGIDYVGPADLPNLKARLQQIIR